MGVILGITLTFMVASLAVKFLWEHVELWLKGNVKYKFLDFLSHYIYYGPDIGIDASLSLDSPTLEVLKRRRNGQEYLASRLGNASEMELVRGKEMASKLVDCRFALAKLLVPLLRELEFPTKRNFICELHNKDNVGIFEVVTQDGSVLPYVGNDAVHTLGIRSFHAPLQEEINRRMTLMNPENKDSSLRFAPIAMNVELEKNVNMMLQLTGMDQIRYSLSGSEAVDAALKDIKASCDDKKIIVRFASAYHGHVSGVDFLSGRNHIFLKECSQESIDFIERYHYRIAAVIVNPMQHFTGINKPSPPGEKVTVSSRIRQTVAKEEYARWLHALQDKCNYCTKYLTKIAFVLDDIYFAFRVPELFSMNYFVHPDTGAPLKPNVLVLGKAVAAGYPLSMVLGQRGYLNTYDKKYILKLNKTVGTLAAWHGGIVASNVFLESVMNGSFVKVAVRDQLESMIQKFDRFSNSVNARFVSENLPVRLRNFSNTFSVNFLSKSLYNSRYTQYLMAEGIFLGNYSTGKFNLNDDATENDLKELAEKFVKAAIKMKQDGYFEPCSFMSKVKLMVGLGFRFMKNYAKIYYDQIMHDKHIDIEVSHNHPVNKFGHFWSSVFMLVAAYPYIIMGQSMKGCLWFFLTHFVRQSGHFFYEHQDRDIEKLKFGHKDASKKEAVAFLVAAALSYHYRAKLGAFISQYVDINLSIDQYVSIVGLFTVVPHFVEITYQYGYLRGISWALKILTDPITDLFDFYTHAIIHPKWFLDWKQQSATYRLDIKTKKVTKVD